jgi:hypothetical protein
MGHISYLTGASQGGSPSINESIYKLQNTSVLFCSAWQALPPDYVRAARVSACAMEHLDHIVNEILRARDTKLAVGTYANSRLETELNIARGQMESPVTLAQQQAMINAGPGRGRLPGAGTPITLVKLLNKIKHRHHNSANFRIDGNRHIFVVNVDKPNKMPDSIVEFDVLLFRQHCSNVSQHL